MGRRSQATPIPVCLFNPHFLSGCLIPNRYWDWADPKVDVEGFPSLFYTEELTILGTGQKSVTVPNPLTSFRFPYIPRDFSDNTRVSAIGDNLVPLMVGALNP